MALRSRSLVLAAVLTATGASASQYPLLDMVAQNVIQKYQSASCEQLWEARGKPKSQQEQEMIQLLEQNPQARQVFIDQIAGPVVNKMFQCGLVP